MNNKTNYITFLLEIVFVFVLLIIIDKNDDQQQTQEPPRPTMVVQGHPAVSKKVQAQRAFDSRERLKKRVVRGHLRRMARKAPIADAGKINRILVNEDEFEIFYEGFVGQKYNITEDTTNTIIDSIKDLLQFLVDNQDGIIKFISTLIDLFGDAEPPSNVELPSGNVPNVDILRR